MYCIHVLADRIIHVCVLEFLCLAHPAFFIEMYQCRYILNRFPSRCAKVICSESIYPLADGSPPMCSVLVLPRTALLQSDLETLRTSGEKSLKNLSAAAGSEK